MERTAYVGFEVLRRTDVKREVEEGRLREHRRATLAEIMLIEGMWEK